MLPLSTSNSILSVILLLLISNCDKLITTCNKTETNMWTEVGRMTGLLFHNCLQLKSYKPQEQFLILQQCLKRKSLHILDQFLSPDVIELYGGIQLVRYQTGNDNKRMMVENEVTSNFDKGKVDWKTQVFQRLAHVLDTHVLKIHFENNKELTFEERGRRRRNMMMPIMMFGMMALGMIMIPMGFQFLAVLGGKALLLAKMALILTSIQGLKKIATSNVNYGLYSTPNQSPCKNDSSYTDCYSLDYGDSVFVSLDFEDLSHSGHYDRQWPYESEGHEAYPNNNYYGVPEQQTDLLHPFHPRIDTIRRKYIIEK